MTIAVDYDGTLEIDGNMNFNLIRRLKAEQKKGNIVILWSCRNSKRLDQAILKLKQVGFIPNLINENTLENVKRLGYNPRKILADIYIDDKNVLIK